MAIAPGKIYVNRPVRIKANFQIDGTDTDPTDVTFQTLSPSRVEASYAYSDDEVYRSGVGRKHRCDPRRSGPLVLPLVEYGNGHHRCAETWPTSDYDL